MKKGILIVYLIGIIILAFATFIERVNGSEWAHNHIYGSSYFIILWVSLGISMCSILFKKAFFNSTSLLHLSFLVMIIGGCFTHYTSKHGMIHLRQCANITDLRLFAVHSFIDESTAKPCLLPFSISLDTFIVKNYLGTQTPENYISKVKIHAKTDRTEEISMNKVLNVNQYRFFQGSFDEDLQGTWLLVNYDPWGTPIIYGGYLLFFLSILWNLLSPKSRFRMMLNDPLLKRISMFLLISVASITITKAQTISQDIAKSYQSKEVLYLGRVTPLNTVARDFIVKLYGKYSYNGQSPEQVLLGCLTYPDLWKKEPLFTIKNKTLQRYLNCKEYACYTDFFDIHGNYKLEEQLHKAFSSSMQQKEWRKEIIAIDQKVAMFTMLRSGTLYKPVSPTFVNSSTPLKITAELWYNKIGIVNFLYKFNLILGGVMLLFLLSKRSFKQFNIQRWAIYLLLLFSFIFLSIEILLRSYISGQLALGSGYETMLMMAWFFLLLSILLHRTTILSVCFGFILSGFTLLIAQISQMNPQITLLDPILLSPLLGIHVILIMAAFSLLGFIFLNSLIAIVYFYKKEHIEIQRLALLSKVLLYPSVSFLGLGILIGSIWANTSWGRYWGWDPKEVWALITFLVYSLAFHDHIFTFLRKPIYLHLFLLLAFSMVVMTYWGINTYFGGLHSYS